MSYKFPDKVIPKVLEKLIFTKDIALQMYSTFKIFRFNKQKYQCTNLISTDKQDGEMAISKYVKIEGFFVR